MATAIQSQNHNPVNEILKALVASDAKKAGHLVNETAKTTLVGGIGLVLAAGFFYKTSRELGCEEIMPDLGKTFCDVNNLIATVSMAAGSVAILASSALAYVGKKLSNPEQC